MCPISACSTSVPVPVPVGAPVHGRCNVRRRRKTRESVSASDQGRPYAQRVPQSPTASRRSATRRALASTWHNSVLTTAAIGTGRQRCVPPFPGEHGPKDVCELLMPVTLLDQGRSSLRSLREHEGPVLPGKIKPTAPFCVPVGAPPTLLTRCRHRATCTATGPLLGPTACLQRRSGQGLSVPR
jgi:hypothetical protein